MNLFYLNSSKKIIAFVLLTCILLFSSGCLGANKIIDSPKQVAVTNPVISTRPLSTSTKSPHQTMLNPKQIHQLRTMNILLKNNGNCSLPCWWGLNVGEDTIDDVNNWITEVGLVDYFIIDDQGTLNFPFYLEPVDYVSSSNLTVYFTDNKISKINVSVERVTSDINPDELIAEWENIIDLRNLVSSIGYPDQVYILKTSHAPGLRATVHLIYNNLSMDFKFEIPIQALNKNTFRYCFLPNMMTPISINIYDTSINSILLEIESKYNIMASSKWEAVIGTPIENFYELFENTDKEICFDQNISLNE